MADADTPRNLQDVTAVEALRVTVDERLRAVDRLLAEMDRRYTERFQAQETAARIARDADTREFHEHLVQVVRENELALAAAEKLRIQALIAMQRAVETAAAADEKRFDSVNEFRRTLSDQTASFMPRSEVTQGLDSLKEQIAELKTFRDQAGGGVRQRQIINTMIVTSAAVMGVLLSLIIFLSR